MAPYDWNTIRQNIFAGESGGDYDALFGYSNRPGRQFEGTRLTDMTVDQALNFANPSGAYGQWVKGQVGRVATPMGAYQVVGTTLRDAKRGLGLRGDEKMTPDLQDRIGRWIYETQGTGAWEGYKPDAGARSVAADTMQALGKGKTMTPMVPTAAPQQERKGFLGGLLSDPDLMDRLAIGLTGMTMNPNVGLQQVASARIAKRAEERNVNKTVEMLKRMEAPEEVIALAEAGYGGEAMKYMAGIRSQRGLVVGDSIVDPVTGRVIYKGETTPDIPKTFQSLDMTARAGGLKPKSEGGDGRYEEFMVTAGSGMRAESAARGKGAGEAQISLAGAQQDVEQINKVIDDILTDPALYSSVGAIQGRLPDVSGGARRFASKLEQLSGLAFLNARQMLKGGGAITDFESGKAEKAFLRMQTSVSEEDFIKAMNDFKDAVNVGLSKLQSQAGAGSLSPSQQAPTQSSPSSDPLNLFGGNK